MSEADNDDDDDDTTLFFFFQPSCHFGPCQADSYSASGNGSQLSSPAAVPPDHVLQVHGVTV